MFRIFRLARLTYMLSQLEMIVNAFIAGMIATMGALLLVVFSLFTGAVFTTFWLLKDNDSLDEEHRDKWWGSMGSSMISLLRIMTFDWAEIVMETGYSVPMAYAFLLAFMVLAGLGVMSLFAAIFVDTLLSAKLESERIREVERKLTKESLQDDVELVLSAGDTDNTGTLTIKELRLVFDILDTCSLSDYPEVKKLKTEIKRKKQILGMQGTSFRAAIDLVAKDICTWQTRT